MVGNKETGRLLVLDDDEGVAGPLLTALRREGHEAVWAATGDEALTLAAEQNFDMVLLDLGLPDIDGLEVCRRLRNSGYDGGVLILTARASELDLVVGLDCGADDYLAKPLRLAELMARSRAVMRRSIAVPRQARPQAPPPATEASLVVHSGSRRAWIGADELQLTEKEFDLLAQLDQHRGQVVTREQLMDEVWDVNWFGSTKTLDVTMARLRQKLADAGADDQIRTIRGVGFRVDEPIARSLAV